MLEYITMPDTLPPVGIYSHAVRAGDFLFVTGQIAEDPDTGKVELAYIEHQARRVMDNLKMVIEHAGAKLENAVMTRIFLTDFRYYSTVNEIYASYFSQERLPARTTIGAVTFSNISADLEIDLVIYCGN